MSGRDEFCAKWNLERDRVFNSHASMHNYYIRVYWTREFFFLIPIDASRQSKVKKRILLAKILNLDTKKKNPP